MEPFITLRSRVVALLQDNIDTDQIIPARFLKTTGKMGLGANLFDSWRYKDGAPRPDFVLNRPESQGAQVLIAGDNFGCGSSREHAPWALLDWGFRAVISTSFADIFRNNALKNGLLPVAVSPELHGRLQQLAARGPFEVEIDLVSQSITLPDGSRGDFPIDGFSKACLLDGADELGYLMARSPLIDAYESSHPARVSTHASNL